MSNILVPIQFFLVGANIVAGNMWTAAFCFAVGVFILALQDR